MHDRKMPVHLDLIEQLYAMGELSVDEVYLICPDRSAAWRAIAALVTSRVAALGVVEEGAIRILHDWESSAVIRNRIDGSAESTPIDEALRVCATDRTSEAYHRDFGEWCYKQI